MCLFISGQIYSNIWSENWRLGCKAHLCPLPTLDHVPLQLCPQRVVCHVDHSRPFPRAGEENQTLICSMSEMMTHLSLKSWICQSLKMVKRHGNLKKARQVIAHGRWLIITVMIIISVIGAGNKPQAEALSLVPAHGQLLGHNRILTAPGDPVRQRSWVGSVDQGPCRWSPPKAS